MTIRERGRLKRVPLFWKYFVPTVIGKQSEGEPPRLASLLCACLPEIRPNAYARIEARYRQYLQKELI